MHLGNSNVIWPQLRKGIQILKGEASRLLGNSNWIRLLFRNEVRIQVGFHKLHQAFISSLSLQFSTSVKISQIWAEIQWIPSGIDIRSRRNWHTKLGLSALNEIDTRSRRNRHTISTWSTDETNSFKMNNILTIDIHWSHQIQIKFIVASCNSH